MNMKEKINSHKYHVVKIIQCYNIVKKFIDWK